MKLLRRLHHRLRWRVVQRGEIVPRGEQRDFVWSQSDLVPAANLRKGDWLTQDGTHYQVWRRRW